MNIKKAKAIRLTVRFTGLTYLLICLMAIAIRKLSSSDPLLSIGVSIIGQYSPLIAVLLMKYLNRRKANISLGLSVLRINRWLALSLLVPVAISLLTLAFEISLPGIEYTSQMTKMYKVMDPQLLREINDYLSSRNISSLMVMLIIGILSGVTYDAFIAFGEEAGWRGFLFPVLKIYGFWRASLLIGLIWGFAHSASVVLNSEYYSGGKLVLMVMTIFTMVLLSPLLNYIRIKSDSVLTCAIFHGVFNGVGAIPLIFTEGGNVYLIGPISAAGLVALLYANVALYFYRKYYDLR